MKQENIDLLGDRVDKAVRRIGMVLAHHIDLITYEEEARLDEAINILRSLPDR
jgi:hypothetical protein